MASRHAVLLLFSALLLLSFLSSKAAAQQATAPSPSEFDDGVEVIPNVENNKEVQELGILAVDELNRKHLYPETLAFYGVVQAKRWQGVYDWDYFLIVESEKEETKIKGRLYVYVYAIQYGKRVKGGYFEATCA